ncbi:hypothetical protein D3C72_2185500 [compost metagenome]
MAQLDAWQRQGRRVLVSCALGYSRSALVAAAWLARRQGLRDAGAALALLREHRPAVVLGREHAEALQRCLDRPAMPEPDDGR